MRLKKSLSHIALAVLTATSFVACNNNDTTTQETSHFSYTGTTGPANWYKLSPDWSTCENGLTLKPVVAGETHQSPVDFSSTSIATAPNFQLDANRSLEFKIENNGHTIELIPEVQNEKNTLIVNGKEYVLAQFHFHAHSEHTENNNSAAMETHFVFKSEDGALAVIGAFIDKNDTVANSELSKIFVAALPEEGDVGVSVAINVANILPHSNVYSYSGSLTTPPCTENVTWNVYTSHINLSTSDVNEFTTLYPNNFRPVTGTY